MLLIMSHWPNLEIRTPIEFVQIDKILHAIAYGLLTFFLVQARIIGRQRSNQAVIFASTAVAFIYAILDELTQPYVGRSCDPVDFIANTFGIVTVFILYLTGCRQTGRHNFRTMIIRALWLLITPTMVLIVILPEANIMLLRLYRQISNNTHFDKTIHFSITAILAWLLAAAYPAGRDRPKLSAGITIIIMICSAPVIEFIQQLTGRGIYDQSDIWAHELGLLAGLLIWAVVLAVQPWMALVIHKITGKFRKSEMLPHHVEH